MTKSLMISIKPQHAVNILNGKKTLELRTWIPKDYVGWVYAYVTKGKKDILYKYKDKYYIKHYLTLTDCEEVLNSKVAFRFWFDEYIKLDYEDTYSDEFYWRNSIISGKGLEKASCLSQYDIVDYGKGKDLYAWHIKKLEIFDEPKELSDFIVGLIYLGDIIPPTYKKLEKPPQRSVWVYAKENEK